VFTTLFCLYWDFKWDWGLFRGTTRETWLLRDQTKFSPLFYYCLMITNTALRFWWVIPTLSMAGNNFGVPLLYNFQVMVFLGMIAEAVRRGLWSIVRVENEFFNNFEQYRTILTIPPM